MYQVKFTDGYEITVMGNLCRIWDNKVEKFCGTWNECLAWLKARGVTKQIG